MDITTAQEMYDLYVKAEKAVLKNQSYSIGDKELRRVDIKYIRTNMNYWKQQVAILTPGNKRHAGPTIKLAEYSHVS